MGTVPQTHAHPLGIKHPLRCSDDVIRRDQVFIPHLHTQPGSLACTRCSCCSTCACCSCPLARRAPARCSCRSSRALALGLACCGGQVAHLEKLVVMGVQVAEGGASPAHPGGRRQAAGSRGVLGVGGFDSDSSCPRRCAPANPLPPLTCTGFGCRHLGKSASPPHMDPTAHSTSRCLPGSWRRSPAPATATGRGNRLQDRYG